MPELEPQPTDADSPPEPAISGLPRGAWELASAAHAGQRRKGDGSPFIVHPTAVARLVADHGGDEEMIAAALLHDILEDSDTAAEEVVERFGDGVGGLVIALSDDPRIDDYAERKRALRAQVEEAGERAQRIYAADKLANSRELLRAYRAQGEAIEGRYKAPLDLRVLIWREDLAMLASRLGRTALVAELEAALEALEAELADRSA